MKFLHREEQPPFPEIADRATLEKIQASIRTFPTKVRTNQSIVEYDYCRRGRLFDNLSFVGRRDGVIAMYVRQLTLSDESHRFKFGDTGYVEYHREAYNVDSQALPGRPLTLQSSEAVLEHEGAARELSWLGGQIIKLATDGWPTEPVSMSVISCPIQR